MFKEVTIMEKNLNKVRDMKHAKYRKYIIGDEIALRRIKLMYEDLNPILKEDKRYASSVGDASNVDYLLIFKVEMSVWNEIVKNLGLKCNKNVRQKREWRIA